MRTFDGDGRVCPVCGTTLDDFMRAFRFGCPHCYDHMRDVAVDSAKRSHLTNERVGKRVSFDVARYETGNVVSSRVRFARNVDGIAFPNNSRGIDREKRIALRGAVRDALAGKLDFDFVALDALDDLQLKALVERHLVSPALVRNRAESAALIERTEGVTVMINEEDHLRVQSVRKGFDLVGAYDKAVYCDKIIEDNLPIARDDKLGYLTACPTNLGTGMRASTMLFLPALRMINAIDDTVRVFTDGYGLTIRGVYGEGSNVAYDTYQLSNTRTLGTSEREILEIMHKATVAMCNAEKVAVERLKRERGAEIREQILPRIATLVDSVTMSGEQLMRLVADLKIGIEFGYVEFGNPIVLDELSSRFTAASLTVKMGELSPLERDLLRARLVKGVLAEAK